MTDSGSCFQGLPESLPPRSEVSQCFATLLTSVSSASGAVALPDQWPSEQGPACSMKKSAFPKSSTLTDLPTLQLNLDARSAPGQNVALFRANARQTTFRNKCEIPTFPKR